MRSLTPSAAGEVSVRLNAGDLFDYDPLSRLLSAQRTGGDQWVRYQDWDLGGRPKTEIVGTRQSLTRTYDVFDNPLQTTLPADRLQPAGGIAGWSRSFDTLGHQVSYTYDAAGRLLFREHRGRRPPRNLPRSR